jgi:rhamnopyranosyl-N-acetylglucosaminyl-diphospho-decaprenol beta-1,3/1,4-galactofuranosyltransferase
MNISEKILPLKSTPHRVCAVLVTYNRLDLLRQALAAVRAQSRQPDIILVVDNGSTDGTGPWLAGEADAQMRVITQPNLGGSGGFHTGMLAAYETGTDWLWCMDDDTIPDPDCLAQILAAEERSAQQEASTPLGWICSVVRWSDGTPHRMNEPKVEGFLRWGADVLRQKSLPAQWCSFVSVAVSREAIARCGLPLKDMFIWYDDVEYTARITTSGGFRGLIALESQVEHRTKTNYAPDVEDIDASNLWRFRYAFRNEILVLRTLSRGCLRKLTFSFVKLMLRRTFLILRAGKLPYLPLAIWQGFKGLCFPMVIEPLDPRTAVVTAPATATPIAAHALTSSPVP